MEMLEHVPEPEHVLSALASLVRRGGHVFISTINRNLKAFLLAIVGAEYLLRLLPRGYSRLRALYPSLRARRTGPAAPGLDLVDLAGIEYNPITRRFLQSDDATVNYLAHLTRAGA